MKQPLMPNTSNVLVTADAIHRSGVQLLVEGKTEEAIARFQQVLQLNLNYPSVWTNLAIALSKLEKFETAAVCAHRAVELAPTNPSYLSTYASRLADLDQLEKALQLYTKAIHYSRGDFDLRFNYATLLKNSGRLEEAIALFKKLLKERPSAIDTAWNLAITQLELGDFKNGWEAFEIRSRRPIMDQERFYPTIPRWRGENIKGKTLLIYEEQGFGDTILCSRYIPLIHALGGKVILECRPQLHNLFSAIPGIIQIAKPRQAAQKFDYHVPIMSLPGIFSTELTSIPPPPPLQDAATLPQRALDLLALGENRLKVGIVWSGKTSFIRNRNRSTTIDRFPPLAAIPGVQLYSLQKGPRENDLAACGGEGLILPLGPELNDFSETAAVVKQLDLIIMTDSSVAHLAGSLGVPVWNLLDFSPFWLYLTKREDSPWYPSMRLFRQPKPGDWDSVFERVAAELTKAAALKKSGEWPLSDKVASFLPKTVSDQADLLFKQGKYPEVIALYQDVLQSNAHDATAWGNLGIALRHMNDHAAAVICLKRASELDPQSFAILRHYAICLTFLNRKEEALQVFADVVRALPRDFLARAHYAFALREFDLHSEALEQFLIARLLNPESKETRWDISKAYLALGHYRQGWQDFEVRWELGREGSLSELAEEEKSYKSKRWQGEDLKDKTILIYAEQGFGDTMLCSRYIPLVKARGARVILMEKPHLHRLLHTIPGLDRLVQDRSVDERVDYHVPIMSLPALFGTELGTIPPLPALYIPKNLPAELTRRLSPGQDRFRVGIVWSGSPTFGSNYKRATAFKRFLQLAEIANIQLYSLQKGPAEQELIDCDAEGLVIELGTHVRDFADTADVLQKLDLVIMTDSSVAHLAGSIGCPIWNLLSTGAYWLYMTGREDSPWYPSMRLFRQPEPGDWDSVFEKVTAELAKAVALKKSRQWPWTLRSEQLPIAA
jgi:tetratricopeptide (TPR) repeat protein